MQMDYFNNYFNYLRNDYSLDYFDGSGDNEKYCLLKF